MNQHVEGDSARRDEGPAVRRFQLPALQVAAAEFRAQQRRAMRGPFGCLFLLAGAALIGSFLLFLDSGGGRIGLGGLVALALGSLLVRFGGGILGAWIAALGTGGAVAGVMLLSGIEATWVYWTVAGLFGVVGFLVVGTASGTWPGFFQARSLSRHTGCRIGFFRPFHSDYSAQAKNLLLPMLRGYGSVFFVVDDSFDESKFDGLWSKDYKDLPGLVGGHRYTDDEWQRQVLAQLENIDVAIVDISVPSANLVWEIKQCYDRLPSYRIIFVANAVVLSGGIPSDFATPEFQQALWSHFEQILKGLMELGANPTTKPLCLVYSPQVEGQVWLAHAVFQAMSNIVAVETGALPSGTVDTERP